MKDDKIPFYYNENGKFIDTTMSDIEKIMHSRKINYNDLKRLFDPYKSLLNNSDTINIYIDLFDILRPLYSPLLKEQFNSISYDDKLNLIVELINLIAHYRHFFVSRYQKYVTIVLYYSDKKDKYFKSIYPEYKNDYYNKRLLENNSDFFTVSKTLYDIINIFKEFISYVPHTFIINTKDMDPLVFPYMIKNVFNNNELKDINPDDFTIIFSNNKVSILDLLTNNNTIIFHCDGKYSFFTDNTGIYNYLNIDNNDGLSNNYLYELLSISGIKEFNIPNVSKKRLKSSYKFITKKINNFDFDISTILSNRDKIKEVFNELNDNDINIIYNNNKILNHTLYPFSKKDKDNIISQLIYIHNTEYIKQSAIKDFNNKIILMEYLFDGEEI